MKVSTQRTPDSQIVLEIEVDAEQMERSLDKAYRKLVQRVEVPGFRKGKTPRDMLERHVGRERLLHEAHDILIPEAYSYALDEQAIDPIGQPDIELLTHEPLSFKATVPLRPTVDLGDYQALRVEREPVSVDEADVERSLEELRRRYAVHEPVERPVQMGDIIRADVRGVIDDNEVYKDEDVEFRMREGATLLLPGFAEGLIGAEKAVEKAIPITVPPGEGSLAGKSGIFTAIVREVKQEQLPELTDQFAREVGEGFTGLEALRERLRSDIRERIEAQANESYRDRTVGALAEQATKIEFPPVLVDREIEHIIRDQARSVGQEVEQYVAMIKRTPQQLREELTPPATERVRRSLALTQLSEDQEIKAEPNEVDAEIERIAASAGQQAEQFRRLFSTTEARAGIERSLITRKTVDFLVEVVSQGGGKKKPSRKKETGKNAAAFEEAKEA